MDYLEKISQGKPKVTSKPSFSYKTGKMLLPFHYKVYESAPLATFVNIFLKIIGAALLVAGIPLLFEADGPIAIVLVAVGVCFLILGNVLGNVLVRRKVKKLYGKDGSKLKKLIPMKGTVTEENGVNTASAVLGAGDLGKQLEFVVRPGEEVIIHYSEILFTGNDFGVGDVIVPKQEKRRIPTQLTDFAAM